jgi:hypothetical protein
MPIRGVGPACLGLQLLGQRHGGRFWTVPGASFPSPPTTAAGHDAELADPVRERARAGLGREDAAAGQRAGDAASSTTSSTARGSHTHAHRQVPGEGERCQTHGRRRVRTRALPLLSQDAHTQGRRGL